jgi:hypothetical protein
MRAVRWIGSADRSSPLDREINQHWHRKSCERLSIAGVLGRYRQNRGVRTPKRRESEDASGVCTNLFHWLRAHA